MAANEVGLCIKTVGSESHNCSRSDCQNYCAFKCLFHGPHCEYFTIDNNACQIFTSNNFKNMRHQTKRNCRTYIKGDWRVMVRRINGEQSFARTFREYEYGFGGSQSEVASIFSTGIFPILIRTNFQINELWWGLRNLHEYTAAKPLRVQFFYVDWKNRVYTAIYDKFQVIRASI